MTATTIAAPEYRYLDGAACFGHAVVSCETYTYELWEVGSVGSGAWLCWQRHATELPTRTRATFTCWPARQTCTCQQPDCLHLQLLAALKDEGKL